MNIDTYKIIFTNTAKNELKSIYLYISKKLMMNNSAKKLMKKIEKNIFMLKENPYSARKVRVKPYEYEYHRLVIDKYIVLYRVNENNKEVVIYRVLYEKRDYLKYED